MKSVDVVRHPSYCRHLSLVCGAAACILASAWHMPAAAAQGPAGSQGPSQAGGERRGPPPEAMAACDKLATGSACSFKHNGRDLKGTCWAPQGKPLACKPQGGPAGPSAGTSAPRR